MSDLVRAGKPTAPSFTKTAAFSHSALQHSASLLAAAPPLTLKPHCPFRATAGHSTFAGPRISKEAPHAAALLPCTSTSSQTFTDLLHLGCLVLLTALDADSKHSMASNTGPSSSLQRKDAGLRLDVGPLQRIEWVEWGFGVVKLRGTGSVGLRLLGARLAWFRIRA